MAAINIPNPYEQFRRVQPRTGFPVQNQGGIPRFPTAAPPKPFVTQPTVAAGPPGPPMRNWSPTPGGWGGATPVPRTGTLQLGRSSPLPTVPVNPLPTTLPSGWSQPRDTMGQPPIPAPSGQVPAKAPPAPAPAAAVPAAAAPTPAPPPVAPTPAATPPAAGQTGATPPAQGDLEQQIRDYIAQGMKGSVTPEFIQRAKEQVFRNVGGQTRQSIGRINEDAIRRGLFKSGIPAEGIANVEAASKGAMASGIADILNAAEQQNIQGRQAAAGTAGQLLSANRSWQQYLDEKARADAAAAGGGGGPSTFEYIDPDTGQVYTMDEAWF